MLSDEQLLAAWDAGLRAADNGRSTSSRDHVRGGLRAVEAAIRRDQIEKDANLADGRLHPDSKPCGVCDAVAAIRAQSPGEVTDDGPWEYQCKLDSLTPDFEHPWTDVDAAHQCSGIKRRRRPASEWEPVPATTEGEN